MAFLNSDEKKHLSAGENNRVIPAVKSLMLSLLDLILPPKCLKCAARVEQAHNICPDCWKDLHFISDPKCSCCGYPFEFDLGNDSSLFDENICGACQKTTRSFDCAVSALRYDDDSRQMVIGFKHQDKPEYAAYFAKLLKQAGTNLFADTDIIIPVPLHRKRLFTRRYNQSALLTRILARDLSISHFTALLVRTKNTPPQQGNLNKRFKNVSGAFRVAPKFKNKIKNKNVLLVDDVYTTGSTAENCAKSLKRAGADKVYVLTVFRVIAPQNPK